MVRDVHAANIPIIALCSASFVLVQAGLLDGRRCAVHFTLRDEFRERFPLSTMVIDKSYVDDRAIITCPGGTAIDLAANLIRRRCGAVRAQKGLEYLLVDEQAEEEVDKAASDSVYQNDRVQRRLPYMRANLDVSMTLKALAEAVGTHPRQLHREFVADTQEPPALWSCRVLHADRPSAPDIFTSYGFPLVLLPFSQHRINVRDNRRAMGGGKWQNAIPPKPYRFSKGCSVQSPGSRSVSIR